jgi:hypothetical protein
MDSPEGIRVKVCILLAILLIEVQGLTVAESSSGFFFKLALFNKQSGREDGRQ